MGLYRHRGAVARADLDGGDVKGDDNQGRGGSHGIDKP